VATSLAIIAVPAFYNRCRHRPIAYVSRRDRGESTPWQLVGNVDFVAESVPLLGLKQFFSRGLPSLLEYEPWHTESFNGLMVD